MGLFVREDPHYDPDVRQVGFNRYKQLLSRHAFSWIKLNLLTVLGALPLAAGVGCAVLVQQHSGPHPPVHSGRNDLGSLSGGAL